MRFSLPTLLFTALLASGCPSAYQRTYDTELGRLEGERRAREQVEAQEAGKFVAVVLFEVNRSEIDDTGSREIDWFLEQIAPYPSVHVEVKGYADSTGSEAHNEGLSNERAWAVQDYLISRGLPPERVSISAFGSRDPERSNQTAKGRKQNRRAVLRTR
ncbi:MAG: OmpA family protein [Myxococcota bacterium]